MAIRLIKLLERKEAEDNSINLADKRNVFAFYLLICMSKSSDWSIGLTCSIGQAGSRKADEILFFRLFAAPDEAQVSQVGRVGAPRSFEGIWRQLEQTGKLKNSSRSKQTEPRRWRGLTLTGFKHSTWIYLIQLEYKMRWNRDLRSESEQKPTAKRR